MGDEVIKQPVADPSPHGTGSGTVKQSETKVEPPIFTPDEAKAAAMVIDKIVQRALVNALTDVVQPAIRKAFVQALVELGTRASKPGGGQEGSGSTGTKQSEGG